MLKLALRNIFRNRRRTIVTSILVISGTFLLGSMRFLAFGLEQDMISRTVQLDSGFLEVAAYGWKERRSLERALETEDSFLSSLRVSGVRAISPRIRSGALLTSGDRTRFISVLAANPTDEQNITSIHTKLETGTVPTDTDIAGAMIGYRLAHSTGMTIGSEFFLVSSQFDGSIGAIPVRVVGIYRANQTRLDASQVNITLRAGERLFGTSLADAHKNYYTSIALGVEDFLAAREIKDALMQRYPTPGGNSDVPPELSERFDPVILDWQDVNPEMMEVLTISHLKMGAYLVFFILSISFGILNTVQMSIQERLREFGVLMAVGTSVSNLVRMVLFEVVFLVVPAVLLGLVLATLPSAYFDRHPFDLTGTGMGQLFESFGMMARLRPMVEIGEVWQIAAWLILPALGMGVLAALRLRKLDPIRLINLQ